MHIGERFRTVHSSMVTVSGVLAFLTGAVLAAYAIHSVYIHEPPPGFQGFWDPPPLPSEIGVLAIALMLTASIWHLWTGRVLPLLVVWAAFVCGSLAETVPLIVPSIRASYGIRPISGIDDIIYAFIYNRLLVVSVLGLVLVLLPWLRLRREKANTEASDKV